MEDLVVWLRQQLDEDERVAREAAADDPPPWHIDKYDGRIKSGPYTVVHIEDSTPRPPAAAHIARHDPARVLLDVDAKRLILDDHAGAPVVGSLEAQLTGARAGSPRVADYCEAEGWCRNPDDGDLRQRMPCRYVRLLALPYSGRPGYREEWKP